MSTPSCPRAPACDPTSTCGEKETAGEERRASVQASFLGPGWEGLVVGDQEPGRAVCGAQAPKLDSSSWHLGADPDKIVTSY